MEALGASRGEENKTLGAYQRNNMEDLGGDYIDLVRWLGD